MITLNDYLYSGDTVFRIIQKYIEDLRKDAKETRNEVDMMHCNFLVQILELLEHNEFLTVQSQKIRDFYMYMAKEYPYLAFTFKGRIKSLIRAEEKFNGYIVEYIYDYYMKNRIVISMPKCHLKQGVDKDEQEIKILYEIANILLGFLEERGFTAEPVRGVAVSHSKLLNDDVRPYYRDYISDDKSSEYQSLHITFFDNIARCFMEVQLRTKTMDDNAEIGPANHLGYEKKQEHERARRDMIPKGECIYFDEAYERGMKLQQLELSKLDVNMFAAVNNSLINDGCGLYRGRQILPYEHLSRFQNDLRS